MVPAHDTDIRSREAGLRIPMLKYWVRTVLLVIAAGLIVVFVLAWRIDPYGPDGKPLKMGTHRQLGMAECNFKWLFGRPCPTCGMTTSFALLVRGDFQGSLKANFAGTMLAIAAALLIPWMVVSGLRGRWLFVRAAEFWILFGVVAAIVLALVRWTIVVGVPWLLGYR